MTTNYTSVPVIASVIGSVTRKAMYLVHVTSLDGEKIYADTWIPIKWNQSRPAMVQYIQWEHHSQSLVEFPMTKATPSMIIEQDDIVRRLVNNKPQSFLQLTNRFIIHLPVWMITPKKVVDENGVETKQDPILKLKYQKAVEMPTEETFDNDNEYYGVAESKDASLTSSLRDYLQDRSNTTFSVQFESTQLDSLLQWERDNPDYQSYD